MNGGAPLVNLEWVTRQRGIGRDSFLLEATSFVVHRGECLALTGPSGCGKSTMLDLLGLILRPDRADTFSFRENTNVIVDVAQLWKAKRNDRLASIRSTSVGYVLQTGGLLPFLRARDNIELSQRLLDIEDGGLVEHLSDRLGIAHLWNRKPRALSIGERQRVSIARALAHRPALLLADEPTASLDPQQAVAVAKLMLDLVSELGMAAVIVSHDWELVRSLGMKEVRAVPMETGAGVSVRFAC